MACVPVADAARSSEQVFGRGDGGCEGRNEVYFSWILRGEHNSWSDGKIKRILNPRSRCPQDLVCTLFSVRENAEFGHLAGCAAAPLSQNVILYEYVEVLLLRGAHRIFNATASFSTLYYDSRI
jgi:hypothetical protein